MRKLHGASSDPKSSSGAMRGEQRALLPLLLLRAANGSRAWQRASRPWSSRSSAARSLSTAAHDFFEEQEEHLDDASTAAVGSTGPANAAAAALQRGVPSRLLEFQVSVDQAVARFEAHQSQSSRGMHAHGLLGGRSAAHTSVTSAYMPVWAFNCVVSAECRGVMGVKDPTTPGGLVWKEMEDWQTIAHKKALAFTDTPCLQVYASYRFDRDLGKGLLLPSPRDLSLARPLTAAEAAQLHAPAGAAAAPSSGLRPEQQGPATCQVPLSTAGRLANQQQQGAASASSGSNSQQDSDGANPDRQEQGFGCTAGGAGQPRPAPALPPGQVVIHEPDMRQQIAWQLAYRGLMTGLIEEAKARMLKETGAADVKDVHVDLEVHSLEATLLYLPAYVAHYVHGWRYKHGTSSVIVPQTFYALISGLQDGGVVAPTHISSRKSQVAAASVVGSLGLAAGSGPTWVGLEPLLSMGPVEALTMAFISAAIAGIWAQGLPHARRNETIAQQVRAEREFYKQYDARETKTAAAMAASIAAAEAAGRPPPPLEGGEQADEYMQWLWMDHDWRKWERDEPWNWDAQERRQAAEGIAARTVSRRKERLKYLESMLEDRRKREHEMEQEMHRAQRSRRAPGSRQQPGEFSREGVGGAALAYERRRRDFLGYYQLLGLAEAEDITAEAIKSAFKSQAMQLHPDRVHASGGTGDAVKEAHVHFQRLQIAYDVLRDPEKRRAYDRGQLVH